MSRITDFYQGTGTDDAGRTIDQVLALDNTMLERDHTYIQWLFPLPEPSAAQPQSPVATAEDYDAWKEDTDRGRSLRDSLLTSLGMMRRFYLETTAWRAPRDHNQRRITRILRCLTLCGMRNVAEGFRKDLLATPGAKIGKLALWHWNEATKDLPGFVDPDWPTSSLA